MKVVLLPALLTFLLLDFYARRKGENALFQSPKRYLGFMKKKTMLCSKKTDHRTLQKHLSQL